MHIFNAREDPEKGIDDLHWFFLKYEIHVLNVMTPGTVHVHIGDFCTSPCVTKPYVTK